MEYCKGPHLGMLQASNLAHKYRTRVGERERDKKRIWRKRTSVRHKRITKKEREMRKTNRQTDGDTQREKQGRR